MILLFSYRRAMRILLRNGTIKAVLCRHGKGKTVDEKFIEFVFGTYIVIVLQHIQRQAFAKTSGTDEEKEAVCLLYLWNEMGFINIIIVFMAN